MDLATSHAHLKDLQHLFPLDQWYRISLAAFILQGITRQRLKTFPLDANLPQRPGHPQLPHDDINQIPQARISLIEPLMIKLFPRNCNAPKHFTRQALALDVRTLFGIIPAHRGQQHAACFAMRNAQRAKHVANTMAGATRDTSGQ